MHLAEQECVFQPKIDGVEEMADEHGFTGVNSGAYRSFLSY
jgi:hypothetical protein